MKTKMLMLALIIVLSAFSGRNKTCGQTTTNFKSINEVKFDNEKTIQDYRQFLENQKTPFLKAGVEVFALDGILWTRPYGEKGYCLTPTMISVKEYEKRIRKSNNKKAGIIKSKFYFVNIKVNTNSEKLLRQAGINVPDYVNGNVNVYIPEIDMEKLKVNGVNLGVLTDYGNKTGEPVNSITKSSQAIIWSEGFETATVPGASYNASNGSINCGWEDVSCLSHSGSWSVWCANNGAACNTCGSNYVNDMATYFSTSLFIDISCYDDVYFKYWVNLDLNNSATNDEFRRYQALNGASTWNLQLTATSAHPWDGTGWNQGSILYSGNNLNYAFQFGFTSNWIGTSAGIYLDDLELSGTLSGLPSSASISGSVLPCEGSTQTYTVSATGATSYTWTLPSGWSGSSTSSTISVTVGSGSGSVCATPANSCGNGTQGCQSVTVSPSAGVANVSGSSSVLQGSTQTYSATASNATSYNWIVPSGWNINAGQGSSSISVTVGSNTGNVCVTPLNTCGNGSQECLPVSVSVTGIEDVSLINGLKIIPNPNKGKFILVLEGGKVQNFKIELINAIGQIIYEENLNNYTGNYRKTVDLGNHAKGIYSIQLISQERIYSKKIVVQ